MSTWWEEEEERVCVCARERALGVGGGARGRGAQACHARGRGRSLDAWASALPIVFPLSPSLLSLSPSSTTPRRTAWACHRSGSPRAGCGRRRPPRRQRRATPGRPGRGGRWLETGHRYRQWRRTRLGQCGDEVGRQRIDALHSRAGRARGGGGRRAASFSCFLCLQSARWSKREHPSPLLPFVFFSLEALARPRAHSASPARRQHLSPPPRQLVPVSTPVGCVRDRAVVASPLKRSTHALAAALSARRPSFFQPHPCVCVG